MKLQAEIGDNNYQIEIKREDGKLLARVDDREYVLEASEPEPGTFLFKHDGRIYELNVGPNGAIGEPVKVRVGMSEVEVRLIDSKRLRSAGSGGEHADGIADIKTAMPGKVVRVLRKAGATVEKGDGVIVVEAMKMQNELKSPKSGTVKDVRVTEGATVSAGDILVTIE